MATSAAGGRVYEIGTCVLYEGKHCKIVNIDNSGGYNQFEIETIEGKEKFLAYAYQLTDVMEDEANLILEFSQEFNETEEAASNQTCTSSSSSRFKKVTAEEKSRFMQEQKNKSTIRATDCHQKILRDYLNFIGEHRPVEEIEADELNNILEDFFMSVKRTDGKEYEPSSIRSMAASIHRYLQERRYPVNIMADQKFSGMRNIISAKFKVRCALMACHKGTKYEQHHSYLPFY